MDYETIEYEVQEEGIGVLSLNRPRKYNSVNHRMMEELEDFWRERLYDLDTHIIILRGNGERGFRPCAVVEIDIVPALSNRVGLPVEPFDNIHRFNAVGKFDNRRLQSLVHAPETGSIEYNVSRCFLSWCVDRAQENEKNTEMKC